MPRFLANMPWKGRGSVGSVTKTETHKRTTNVQISSGDLQDLLADFACEKAGLPRSAIVRISLDNSPYKADSLDVILNVTFEEDATP